MLLVLHIPQLLNKNVQKHKKRAIIEKKSLPFNIMHAHVYTCCAGFKITEACPATKHSKLCVYMVKEVLLVVVYVGRILCPLYINR